MSLLKVVMSFFDWIGRKYAQGAADYWNAKAGPPAPKKARKDDSAGFNFPGHKYLGPGNGLDRGEPVDADDAAAQKHDQAYDEQLKLGDNPYIKYNHADREFQEALKDDTSFEGNLARGLFEAKKLIAEPLGLAEPELAPPSGRKRPVPSSQDSGYSSSQDKRPNLDVDEEDREFAASAAETEAGSSPPSSDLGPGTMSAGGGAPMDDAQQGADGVGNASGDWHCDSKWLGDRVLTRSTRTWVLPSYNNHLYKQINTSNGMHNLDGNRYFGYSTPWGYFDFNRFHCHFSPRDWQRLVNNNWGFRPKNLRVKLFNIQVKEVTTVDSTTTVANNLTSTVQVFTDDEYQLPYVCGNASEGCLPPFPPDVFTLPQYGYATLNNPANGEPTERSSFFCLEYFPSKMLRTGNNFEFIFKFEDVPFHTGFAPTQNLFKMGNPLVDQYLYRFDATNATGSVLFKKNGGTNFAQQARNWLTGAFNRCQPWDVNTPGNNRINVTNSNGNNTLQLEGIKYAISPDVNGMCNTIGGSNQVCLDNSLIFNNHTAAPGEGNQLPVANVLITRENETQPVNGYAGDDDGRVANSRQTSSTIPTTENVYQRGVAPGSVWMDRDVYLQGPIWAKIPNTGANFHPSPLLGGFGLKHPPPMLLIKNTPVPGNVTSFTEVKVNNFITQYSTGQITVDIEWELQKENSKRWNPEIQYTNNFTTTTFADFTPDVSGNYRTTRAIGSRWLTRPL